MFAIEPMVNAGGHEVFVADDGWSISTVDGSLSAHFEHTVAVGKKAPRVLTRRRSERAWRGAVARRRRRGSHGRRAAAAGLFCEARRLW